MEGIEKNQKPVLFTYNVSPGASAQMDQWNLNLELPFDDLKRIAKYYAKKILNGESIIKDFNDENGNAESKYFHEQTGYLGHEMLHAVAGLDSIDYGEETPWKIKSECMAHCLQKCIDKNHRQMINECDGDGEDMFCEIDNTCEFIACDKKPPPDEDEEEDRNGGGKGPNVGRDTPDDNFSHASGYDGLNSLMASLSAFPLNLNSDQDFFSYSYYPDILIYNKFNTGAMEHLLDRFMPGNYISDSIHDHFSNNHRLLIVPTCEIMGDQDSAIIQNAFENFVACGGSLLFLTQQYNSQISNFLNFESKETLKTFGFRQDQSCYLKSTYFQEMTPILSSSNDEAITFSCDGYAEIPGSPSDVNVLLYRTKNRQAAMLYYPYKAGHVFITFSYTDFSYSRSMATRTELNIFRVWIHYAKNTSATFK